MKFDISPPREYIIRSSEDISPEVAILELIDTYIEWYKYYHARGIVHDKGNTKIDITDNNRFIIESDYPGPPKNMVIELFKFGGKVDKGHISIGGYGIGTKRAMFKLGQNICLESDDGKEFYSITIDKEWFKTKREEEKGWILELKEEDSKGKIMDRITISDLHADIKDGFTTAFKNKMGQKIINTYFLYINEYINIIFCGMDLGEETKKSRRDFKFIFRDDEIRPYHKKTIVDGVRVEVYAGYTKWKKGAPFGWYIFCNDRLIIKGDTSNRTGFDTNNDIIYNPEDNIFLGLVFFNSYLFDLDKEYEKHLKKGPVDKELEKVFLDKGISLDGCILENKENGEIRPPDFVIKDKTHSIDYKVEVIEGKISVYTDPLRLPWKSSKDDIRDDSKIYSSIQGSMMKPATAYFINYIRDCKDKIKKYDYIKTLIENVDIEKDIKKYDEITIEATGSLPKVKSEEKGYSTDTRTPLLTSIQFWASLGLVDKIKEKLGNVNMSNEKMGEEIFSYFIKREAIKDE